MNIPVYCEPWTLLPFANMQFIRLFRWTLSIAFSKLNSIPSQPANESNIPSQWCNSHQIFSFFLSFSSSCWFFYIFKIISFVIGSVLLCSQFWLMFLHFFVRVEFLFTFPFNILFIVINCRLSNMMFCQTGNFHFVCVIRLVLHQNRESNYYIVSDLEKEEDEENKKFKIISTRRTANG